MFDDNRISQYREAQKQKLFVKPIFPTESELKRIYDERKLKKRVYKKKGD